MSPNLHPALLWEMVSWHLTFVFLQWHCESFQTRRNLTLPNQLHPVCVCVELLLWSAMILPPCERISDTTIYCTLAPQDLSFVNNEPLGAAVNTSPQHHFMLWMYEPRVYTYLCANNFPIGTVAGVAVFVPFGAVWGDVSIDGAVFPCNCDEINKCIRMNSRGCVSEFKTVDILLSCAFFTFMTVRARPVWWTQAAVPVDLIYAGGPEGTWGRLTLVNICQRRTV